MITNTLLTTRAHKSRSEWILLPGLAIGFAGGLLWGPVLGILAGLGFSILLAIYTLLSLGLKESQTLPKEATLFAQADADKAWETLIKSMETFPANCLVSIESVLHRATFETEHAAVEVQILSQGRGESKIVIRSATSENKFRQFLIGMPLFLCLESQLSEAILQLNSQNLPCQRKTS